MLSPHSLCFRRGAPQSAELADDLAGEVASGNLGIGLPRFLQGDHPDDARIKTGCLHVVEQQLDSPGVLFR